MFQRCTMTPSGIGGSVGVGEDVDFVTGRHLFRDEVHQQADDAAPVHLGHVQDPQWCLIEVGVAHGVAHRAVPGVSPPSLSSRVRDQPARSTGPWGSPSRSETKRRFTTRR